MSRYNWMDSITTTGDLRTLSLNELNDADIRLHSGCNHLSCDWRSVIIIRNSRVIHKPKRQGLWTTRNKKKIIVPLTSKFDAEAESITMRKERINWLFWLQFQFIPQKYWKKKI